jgi:DNA-directed RNA polymerase specialized sigma24 family protein
VKYNYVEEDDRVNENEFIELVSQGDPKACAALRQITGLKTRVLIKIYASEGADLRAILNRTYQKAEKNIKYVDHLISLQRWVNAIARNVTMSACWRGRNSYGRFMREGTKDGRSGSQPAALNLDSRAQVLLLQNLLKARSYEQRLVLMMKYSDHLSTEEIAAFMEKPAAEVSTLLEDAQKAVETAIFLDENYDRYRFYESKPEDIFYALVSNLQVTEIPDTEESGAPAEEKPAPAETASAPAQTTEEPAAAPAEMPPQEPAPAEAGSEEETQPVPVQTEEEPQEAEPVPLRAEEMPPEPEEAPVQGGEEPQPVSGQTEEETQEIEPAPAQTVKEPAPFPAPAEEEEEPEPVLVQTEEEPQEPEEPEPDAEEQPEPPEEMASPEEEEQDFNPDALAVNPLDTPSEGTPPVPMLTEEYDGESFEEPETVEVQEEWDEEEEPQVRHPVLRIVLIVLLVVLIFLLVALMLYILQENGYIQLFADSGTGAA